jgi:hypothetical protein
MVSPKILSACKVVNLNPDMDAFMTSTLFVYEAKRKRLAAIHFNFRNGAPQTLESVSCGEGPDTFRELLDELNSKMDDVSEKVTLLCMEDLSGPKKVGEFAAAHLDKVFQPSTMREVEKAYTTILKDCF